MNCPNCHSTNLYHTIMQVFYNTGARYICEDCGEPINNDGSQNEVLLNQLEKAVNCIDEDFEAAMVVTPKTPVIVTGDARELK